MDVPKTPQQELVEHAISAAGQMEQWAKTLSTEMGAGDDTVAIPQRLVSLLVSEMRTRAQATASSPFSVSPKRRRLQRLASLLLSG
jgi:hypothetical protein